MILRKSLITASIFLSFMAIGAFLSVSKVDAAKVYLSPASGSVANGSNINLHIRLDTEGANVSALALRFTFDTAKIDEAGSTYGSVASSPLNQTLFMSLNNGVFSVQQFVPIETDASGNAIPTVPVTGDVFLGTLSLKAAAGSGTVTVAISTEAGNTVVYNHDPQPGVPNSSGLPLTTTGTGGTYNLTGDVVSDPHPPGGSNPPSGSTPPRSSGTKPPPSGSTNNTINEDGSSIVVPNTAGDTKAPTISNIKYTSATATSVVIEWTTDEPGTSYVNYGKTSVYGLGYGTADYSKEHKVTIETNLEASTEYHFQVLSSDQAGNTSFSKDETFRTKPPVEVQRTYRFIGLAMIIGGLLALAVIAFYYFRKKGPHPDNLVPAEGSNDTVANLNPPI